MLTIEIPVSVRLIPLHQTRAMFTIQKLKKVKEIFILVLITSPLLVYGQSRDTYNTKITNTGDIDLKSEKVELKSATINYYGVPPENPEITFVNKEPHEHNAYKEYTHWRVEGKEMFQIICCYKNISTYDAFDVSGILQYYRLEGDTFYRPLEADTVKHSEEEYTLPILTYKVSQVVSFNLYGIKDVLPDDYIVIFVKCYNKRKERQPDLVKVFKLGCEPYKKLNEADPHIAKILTEDFYTLLKNSD